MISANAILAKSEDWIPLVVIAIIALGALGAYLVKCVRDWLRPSTINGRLKQFFGKTKLDTLRRAIQRMRRRALAWVNEARNRHTRVPVTIE